MALDKPCAAAEKRKRLYKARMKSFTYKWSVDLKSKISSLFEEHSKKLCAEGRLSFPAGGRVLLSLFNRNTSLATVHLEGPRYCLLVFLLDLSK